MNTVTSNNEVVVSSNYTFEKVNFKNFSDADWDDFLTFNGLVEAEINPHMPYSPSLMKARLLNDPPAVHIEHWIVRSLKDSSKIIGMSMLNVLTQDSSDYKDNGHTVRTWIIVHPDHRRNKIGTILVKFLCQRGLELDKTEISFSTPSTIGQKFMESFGGKSALDSAENKLDLKEINWDNIQKWNLDAKSRSPDTVIETYESIPDTIIEEYAKVFTAILNDVPFGDLGLKFVITPEQIRKWEKYEKKISFVPIIKITREKDGRISGLTEIKRTPLNPLIIEQNLTGVLRDYRGRNLGLLLKTDMLLTIKEKFSEAKLIFTGNADQNAPMLRINHMIGFKKAGSWKAYKYKITELLEKLD